MRARIGTALTVGDGNPRSSMTAAIGIATFIVSGRPQRPRRRRGTAARARRSRRSRRARRRARGSARARGSSGLCTGWPKPGSLPPAARISRATVSAASPLARVDSSSRAHASDVPRTTGPRRGSRPRRRPAASRIGRQRHPRGDVRRHHPVLGDRRPAAGRGRTAGRRSARSPVSSRWKYSVKLSRPITSPVRSRPRTSTRSAIGLADVADGGPGLTDRHGQPEPSG